MLRYPDLNRRFENLKATLKSDYKSVKVGNRRSHQNNKKYSDRRAKRREFHAGGLVYLYHPTKKPGLSAKFHYPWSGPHKITVKISDLNYEIQDKNDNNPIVHLNRLKAGRGFTDWKSKKKRACTRKPHRKSKKDLDSEEREVRIGTLPLMKEILL